MSSEYGIVNNSIFWECLVQDKAMLFLSLQEAADWVCSQ